MHMKKNKKKLDYSRFIPLISYLNTFIYSKFFLFINFKFKIRSAFTFIFILNLYKKWLLLYEENLNIGFKIVLRFYLYSINYEKCNHEITQVD